MTQASEINVHHSYISQADFLTITEAAIYSGSLTFARQAAISWLAVYPEDMQVNFLYACSLIAEGRLNQAIGLLRELLSKDPEFRDVCLMLGKYEGISAGEVYNPLLYALGEKVQSISNLPDWSHHLRLARQEMNRANYEAAQSSIDKALSLCESIPLIAVTHLRITSQVFDAKVLREFAGIYHQRFPKSVAIALILADAMIRSGDGLQGIKLMHQCVAKDPAGIVAKRLWGVNHRYQSLWSNELSIIWDLPIPAEVAAQFGWNRLPAGELQNLVESQDKLPSSDSLECDDDEMVNLPSLEEGEGEPERELERGSKECQIEPDDDLNEVREVFEKVAKRVRQPDLAKLDGRFPVYVVFSSLKNLEKKYGSQTTAILMTEMRALVEVIAAKSGWDALLYLPDSSEISGKAQTQLVEEVDPWKLKLALNELDRALARKGQMIGAILIVGGDDIVPFHRLPNPTDDSDVDVLSDNPYGTLDNNFFVPEWPVGRLPGESCPDAGLLLGQLRKLVRSYQDIGEADSIIRRIVNWLVGARRSNGKNGHHSSLGYTAAVWKRSSDEVMRHIGLKYRTIYSPPEYSGSVDPRWFTDQSISYFNLHGLADAAEWFGQPDPIESALAPDYPIALSPKDLARNGNAPHLVFTEACYGVYINEKTEENSIALRFVSVGVPVIIGSTCISYGSVTTPLIGADLLGALLWKRLREGCTTGEAFMLARHDFIRDMINRQGYLDGEDQKTLISFVQYGDPLHRISLVKGRFGKIMRPRTQPKLTRINDCLERCNNEHEILGDQAIKEAKKALEKHLPGLKDAEMEFLQQRIRSDVLAKNAKGKEKSRTTTDTMVVRIHKEVKTIHRTHTQFARATLSKDGKILKLALSR